MTLRDRSLGRLANPVRQRWQRLIQPARAWPLRWRLIAVLVCLLGIALTLTSLATTARMRSYLVDRTNEELRVAAEPVARKVLDQLDQYQRTVSGLPSSYAVVFMDEQGRPRVQVYPVDERFQPEIPPLALDDPRVQSGEPFAVESTQGEARWQVLAGPLEGRQGTYAVAASLQRAEQFINQLQAVVTVIGLTVALACVGLGWFAIRRAFRPLQAIEDTAAAIAAGDLTRRVPEHLPRDEVGSLSRSFNAMLAQVETSFAVQEASEARMRRFVADASHELRTPLATVRGYAELFRQGAVTTPESTAGAMRRIEDEAGRMSALVEDLLMLARMEQPTPAEVVPVDLTVLASDAVQDARARDPDRSLRMTGLGDQPIAPTVLTGVEAQLRQVVTNLIANALHHTPTGTPVEVRVGRFSPERVRLEVCDHGLGIPPDHVERVFERFFRADPARGRRDGVGTGLGLAIVAAIVNAHGGSVAVSQTPGGGATFSVDLPSADNDAQLPSSGHAEIPYRPVLH